MFLLDAVEEIWQFLLQANFRRTRLIFSKEKKVPEASWKKWIFRCWTIPKLLQSLWGTGINSTLFFGWEMQSYHCILFPTLLTFSVLLIYDSGQTEYGNKLSHRRIV